MITNETIIKLKGCSRQQRTKVKAILLENYVKLLDEIEKEADYCSIDGYWKGHLPISKPVIDADSFISNYGKS